MLNLKSFLFQKNQRLLNKSDYSYVFESAKKLSTRWFTVLYRPCRQRTISGADAGISQDTRARLGLVVSKKSAKRAVDRNKIKRCLRETFRLNQHELPDIDIVVLSKKGITEADHQTLHNELNYIWRKLSRIV